MGDAHPIHLVIRFSDSFRASVNAIKEHKAVIQREGAVWFAKVGKPLGPERASRIGDQLRRDVRSYAFLVKKGKGGYQWFRATIVAIAETLPGRATRYIPDYYSAARIIQDARLWLKLSRIDAIDPQALKPYRIITSGRPLLDSIRTSMAGMFIVQLSEHVEQRRSLSSPGDIFEWMEEDEFDFGDDD